MNNTSNSQSSRKFIGDAAALGLIGVVDAGYVLSSCTLPERIPEYYD